jgi:hypothetical protein
VVGEDGAPRTWRHPRRSADPTPDAAVSPIRQPAVARHPARSRVVRRDAPGGETELGFNLTRSQPGAYHLAFHIPNNQLQNAMQWTGEKVEILNTGDGQNIANFTNWNARSFYFHDPFQNILEFITHYDLDIRTNDFSGAGDITHIIEAGMVTNDVMATCKKLKEQYKLPSFHKGPVTENFAVMGNESGMLIISKEGRHWYPTDQASLFIEMNLLITNMDRQFALSTNELR